MSDHENTTPLRRRRWRDNWLIRDCALLLPLASTAVLGGIALSTTSAPIQSQVQQMLTLLAVAGAVAAALIASFAGRLDGDAAALRIGSGLLVYGGLVLPITAAGFATSIGTVGRMLDLLALGTVTVLFGLGLLRKGDPTMAWPAAAVAVAVSLGVVASTAVVPALVPDPMAITVASAAVAAVLGVVGILMAASGLAGRSVLLRRVGLGIVLLAVAHGGRGLEPLGVTVPWPSLTGLRPLAVAVVVAGVLPNLLAALRRQRDRDVAAAVALRDAERHADDRDHELRNVVLGLSGAAALLATPGTGERVELGAAVTAELDRLSRMLDRRRADPPDVFEIRPAIATAVAVQRAAGAAIELDVPAGLRARGGAETLTQVVTNLLVNCARHAPGAHVRISASEVEGCVLVLVRDHGPGIAAGQEHAVLERGRRSGVTGGRGLGLGISRDLMRAHGGDLRLTRAPGSGSGCVAILEIPSATAPAPVHELAG